jgi:hypothetical protein
MSAASETGLDTPGEDACRACGEPLERVTAVCRWCGAREPAARPRRGIGRRRLGVLATISTIATGIIAGGALSDSGSNSFAAALLRSRYEASVTLPAAAAAAAASRSGSAADGAGAGAPSAGAADLAEAGAPEDSQSDSSDLGAEDVSAATSDTADTGTTGTTGATGTSGATGPAAATIPETKVKHVFVVMLSSAGYDTTFGDPAEMPYLARLRAKGALVKNYIALSPAALPDRIALLSGQAPDAETKADCPTYSDFKASGKADATGLVAGRGCVYPVDTLTLPDQLSIAGKSWRGYVEDVDKAAQGPKTCRHPGFDGPDDITPAPGDAYATRNNPFVYFHSLLDLGDCAANDVSLSTLTSDLRSARTTPNFAYVAPNLCHDGSAPGCQTGAEGATGAADEGAGPAAADAFLAEWAPRILASPAYRKDGLLIVAFAPQKPAQPGGPPPRLGALLVSQFVKAGATESTDYDPYGLLRSIEDALALDHLGHAADSITPSLMSSVLSGAK